MAGPKAVTAKELAAKREIARAASVEFYTRQCCVCQRSWKEDRIVIPYGHYRRGKLLWACGEHRVEAELETYRQTGLRPR